MRREGEEGRGGGKGRREGEEGRGGASQELCAHHWEGNDVTQLMGVPQSLVKQLL